MPWELGGNSTRRTPGPPPFLTLDSQLTEELSPILRYLPAFRSLPLTLSVHER